MPSTMLGTTPGTTVSDAASGRAIELRAVDRPRSARYARTPWAERWLYRPFVIAALAIALSLGFTVGAGMLIWAAAGSPGVSWATHLQPHGVAQVFGWAGLFVMGVAMHMVPRFRGDAALRHPWPQRLLLALVVSGIVLRAFGQALYARPAGGPLLVLSGVALLAGVLVFTVTIADVLRRGHPSPVRVEHWFWMGLAWSLVAATWHLWIVLDIARRSTGVADPDLDRAFVWAGVAGFVMAFIFGVSRRAVAGFLALRPASTGLDAAAFALMNGGLAWLVLSSIVDSTVDAGSGAAGLLALAVGVGAFAVALRIFEPLMRPAAASPGSYRRYGWFLRAAYGWLVVGAGLLAVSALSELSLAPGVRLTALPALHTIGVGFITMTIVGFGARALPLFEGRYGRRAAALDVTFVALNASALLRLTFGVVDLPNPEAGLAVSGLLGLVGVACFAVFIFDLFDIFDLFRPAHRTATHAEPGPHGPVPGARGARMRSQA